MRTLELEEWRKLSDREREEDFIHLQTQNHNLLAALEDIRRIATTDPTNLPQKMFAGNIAARATAAIASVEETE